MKIRLSDLTEQMVSDLSNEAIRAGDAQTVRDCIATAFWIREGRKPPKARAPRRVLTVINAARAADRRSGIEAASHCEEQP